MTRITLMATAASLALLAMPALAQNTMAPGGAARTPGTPSATMAQPKPDPMKQEDVSEIKGASVYGSDGKKIGSVSTVLMKPENREIDRLVVGVGGVLGVGAHDVALPISDFHWDAQKGGFTVNRTEADLKSMPSWESSGSASLSGSSVPPATEHTTGSGTSNH